MKRKKVLLVDDSKTILLMERMILGNEPFDLITAVNGEEAVAKAQSEMPDLILMDVVMPRMNGFEACRRIRTDETTSEIPVIMVTTRSEMQSVEAGYESGCADYVVKPIDGVELLTKVQSYLGSWSGEDLDAKPC